MLAVSSDPAIVESELVSGEMRCPSCTGPLRPWGWARTRELRARRPQVVRPRRSRCRACAATHALIPTSGLARRRDGIEVIGAALLAKQAGHGHRAIAATLGLPASTVRGWLRRFAAKAAGLRAAATIWAHRVDAMHPKIEPRGSPFADALEAIGLAASATVRRFGPVHPGWGVIAALTGALLLAPQSLPAR